MFGLGKLLGGKAKELKVASKKVENRNLMEAIVGGQLLIAYSEDRTLDDSERAKIEGLLRTNPNLTSFGNEMTDYFNQTNNALKAGYITARLRILREIEEIKNSSSDAQDVMGNLMEVALADGNISEAEEKELKTIAGKLGQNLEDFLQ